MEIKTPRNWGLVNDCAIAIIKHETLLPAGVLFKLWQY